MFKCQHLTIVGGMKSMFKLTSVFLAIISESHTKLTNTNILLFFPLFSCWCLWRVPSFYPSTKMSFRWVSFPSIPVLVQNHIAFVCQVSLFHLYHFSDLWFIHCDKSLGVFLAIARSAAGSYSMELSEVQNPCYSLLSH